MGTSGFLTQTEAMNRFPRRAGFVLLLPVLSVIAVVAALRRRRRVPHGRGFDDGWPPPDGGVREPRRPKPSPSSAAMVIEEDGEPVQA
jgi:hypothetical protein